MESKKTKRNKRMQIWGNDENDDSLIIEILNGQKTATVTSEANWSVARCGVFRLIGLLKLGEKVAA